MFNSTEYPWSQVDSGDWTEGDGTTMDEVSGLTYATDRDRLAVVDDSGYFREYTRQFVSVQANQITFPGAPIDLEGICYIGDSFTEYDYCVLEEGSAATPTRLHLFPFATDAISISAEDVTTYDLSTIPYYSGTYGGEGAEGVAFDQNTGLFYVSSQSDTQNDVGVWEVDITDIDTAGEPSHTLLYTYVGAGIVDSTEGISSPVSISDLEHGSTHPSGEFDNSLFLLMRDGTADRRVVVQVQQSTGEIISIFEHGVADQVEALCFDAISERGDMFIGGEEASMGAV